MAQLLNQIEGGDDYAMEEYCGHVDLDQAMDLSEVDGAILMELMEDLPPSDLLDNDTDRLSNVIRSLEAEIGGGAASVMGDNDGSTAEPSSEEDGRLLEEMLSDLDGYESGSFGYWPPEVPLVGHEAEGWYLYADGCVGSVVGYEAMDHRYHYVESCVEQVYSPLWE